MLFLGLTHAATEQAVPVVVATVEKKDIPIQIELVGTAVASDIIHVNTRVDSQVIKTHFSDGAHIQKDQLLFELDDRLLVTQINELEARLKKQEAELERSQRQFTRDQSLNKSGFTSAQNYDKSRTDLQSAQADILLTKAQLDNLKTQLSFCKILAPVAGVTGTINRKEGNVFKINENNAPLVNIHTVQPLYVKAALPQTDYAALKKAWTKEGSIAAIAYDPHRQEMDQGVIQYQENAFDEASRTLPVYFAFPNLKNNLWPGMFVTIVVKLGQEPDSLIIPSDAIKQGQKGPYVFLLRSGKAIYQDIKVKRFFEKIAVIDGSLQLGDKVIVDGHIRLKDQTPVKIVSDSKRG